MVAIKSLGFALAGFSLLLAGCNSTPDVAIETAAPTAVGTTTGASPTTPSPTPAAGTPLLGTGSPGIDVTLGEWALVATDEEAPPGEITFRYRNLGTIPHALRIRSEGSGGDRLEWRADTIQPGQTALFVATLPPGIYDIDCPIEDAHGEHDALGMEMRFTVSEGAAALPALAAAIATDPAPVQPGARGGAVDIAAFAFEPAEIRVSVGTIVTWTNRDPTSHTATSVDGNFDTGMLSSGAQGTATFDTVGTFEYICVIHPSLSGRVVVEAH